METSFDLSSVGGRDFNEEASKLMFTPRNKMLHFLKMMIFFYHGKKKLFTFMAFIQRHLQKCDYLKLPPMYSFSPPASILSSRLLLSFLFPPLSYFFFLIYLHVSVLPSLSGFFPSFVCSFLLS